jgi:hypothetical protein
VGDRDEITAVVLVEIWLQTTVITTVVHRKQCRSAV